MECNHCGHETEFIKVEGKVYCIDCSRKIAGQLLDKTFEGITAKYDEEGKK